MKNFLETLFFIAYCENWKDQYCSRQLLVSNKEPFWWQKNFFLWRNVKKNRETIFCNFAVFLYQFFLNIRKVSKPIIASPLLCGHVNFRSLVKRLSFICELLFYEELIKFFYLFKSIVFLVGSFSKYLLFKILTFKVLEFFLLFQLECVRSVSTAEVISVVTEWMVHKANCW